MSFLRNLASDLVDKRLWPIAALLVIALVAVPIMLGGSNAPMPSSSVTPAPGPRSASAAQAQISAATTAAVTPRNARSGSVRNPFKQQHVPKPQIAAASTGTTVVPGVTGGNAGGAPVTVQPQSKPKLSSTNFFRVALRFGEAGRQRTIHDVVRLTPLPSSTDPFFVFLGVLADGKTAVFLVSSDATATGDGKCRPRPSSCETIEMHAGDTEFFDLAVGTAGVVQYKLDLVKIVKRKAGSTATAARYHARASKAGRDALRAAIAAEDPGTDAWRFDPTLGVLRAL